MSKKIPKQEGGSVSDEDVIAFFERHFPETNRANIIRLVESLPRRVEQKKEKWQGYRFVKLRSRQDYYDYLQSEEWGWIKTAVWSREGGECHDCGSCEFLQVHHTSYHLIGREWKDNFLTVVLCCKWCHEKRHEKRFH